MGFEVDSLRGRTHVPNKKRPGGWSRRVSWPDGEGLYFFAGWVLVYAVMTTLSTLTPASPTSGCVSRPVPA